MVVDNVELLVDMVVEVEVMMTFLTSSTSVVSFSFSLGCLSF